MKIVALIILALAVVVAAAVGFVLLTIGPNFCDLVAILHAALIAGEAVWDAIKEFAAGVTDSMIADLPEDTQTPARAVLQTAKQIANFAIASLIEPLLGPFRTAVEGINAVCVRLG